MTDKTGTLFLVPTPIGNMADLSRRAEDTLRDADIVACEDTRHSGRLLKALGLSKRLVSYHEFNEQSRARQLVDMIINDGLSVAVVTDAGSPGISDPAYRVVQVAIEHGIPVVPLPGPTSIIPAVTASGLPTDRFFFEGFLPHKSGARKTRLGKLSDFEHTLVFLESPHRLMKSLQDIFDVMGDRHVCVARELTKLHEEILRGTVSEVLDRIRGRTVRGEIVLVVAGTGWADKAVRRESGRA
jgi:16S rRNA (cytidine1402-2'-O)-methyltransferase